MAKWGTVKAYDVETQALKGQFANPEHGVTNIVVADVTADGKADVLWDAGATDSGSDYLYTGSWASRQIVGRNVDLEGPFLGPLVAEWTVTASPRSSSPPRSRNRGTSRPGQRPPVHPGRGGLLVRRAAGSVAVRCEQLLHAHLDERAQAQLGVLLRWTPPS